MEKNLIVLKFGTASITRDSGEPDKEIIAMIASQVAQLHADYRIIIVSSGAVGAGKNYINNYEGTVAQKKAAAAVGNPLLLSLYDQCFGVYGIKVAQSLLERQHFANREQFLQLKQTYEELWKSNIIPIANENDVVSNREIKFSDNDELATLIASGFGAHRLMLCTASGGLLDGENKLISHVKEVNEEVMGLVKNTKTSLGSGGMSSKLTFTRLATKMGIKVTIFGLKTPNGIIEALAEKAGTQFDAAKNSITAKNKWMASGGISVARVLVDDGAKSAVLARKSLLTVGVQQVEGDFQKGELIEVYNKDNKLLAVGKAKVSREQMIEGAVLIHADDLVLL